jgi:uroporphyrinogen III methyltransferase/synthase
VAVGKVYLVGAGPGDPGLLTLRGRACLQRAELVVADYLVNPILLEHAPLTAEVIVRPQRRAGLYGAQEELTALLVERGLAGQTVVRLKGGDPFVFGRGGEEAEALAAAGVPFEVVPGVTAAIAVPAYAGIPVTHRGASGVVAFATGHEADEKDAGAIDWEGVARGAGTVVLYMSVKRLGEVVRRLLAAGRSPDEPVAVIERGTTPRQRTLLATLGDVVEKAAQAKLEPPALTIVGQVVRMREKIAWFDNRPLHGRRILLLSTKDDDGESADAAGAELVRVSPLTVVPRFADVKTALARLSSWRTIAFSSAHAVDAVVGALSAMGHDLRALAGVKLAAVGAATARRLEEMYLRADLIADAGGAALAEEIRAADLQGPVFLPRAAGGREELADGLRAAGYPVDAVDAYDTIPDGGALARVVRSHRARPFDAVGLSSPKGAAAFLEALGGGKALAGVVVGAIGDTTREALEDAGVPVSVVPESPSLSALLDGLTAALAARDKIG